jgi:serine protease
MKILNNFRKTLTVSVGLFIFVPALALAVVANPGQLVTQANRFSDLFVSGGTAQEEMVSQLMVKPRKLVGDQLKTALRARDATRLTNIANVPMSVIRPMSGEAHVIRLEHPVTLTEARAIAARLMSDNSVEIAEPDRIKHAALIPADPDYASYQWNLFAPTTNPGSANLPTAWDITTGSNSVTVAVIDTGYRPHQDLGFTYSGSSYSSPVILPGYNFISDAQMAGNTSGQGPDAQDLGDYVTGAENTAVNGPFYACGTLGGRNGTTPLNQLSPSSWHGTHVSGIIAAQMNSIGIAGIAPNIRILPVRVLGKCGGTDSDIIDGMYWAAGLTTYLPAGIPANPNPAKVLNMSLGGSGSTPCSSSLYQTAVTNIINVGTVIVVAAGNDGTSTLSTPANCAGVIAVTANSIDGDNAYYSTIGQGTTISAPGGGCGGMNTNCIAANFPSVYSLLNTGTTTAVASPSGDTYGAYAGTSMATPHVAAVAALMLSLNPSLTPAQITSYLQSSSRAFPVNTICTQTANAGLCGSGLLDAYQALHAVQAAITAPIVTLGSIPSSVTPGASVILSGSAVTGAGRTLTYAWTQLSGPAVTINNPTSNTNAGFTSPASGTLSFMLTATDSINQTGTATTGNITVTAASSGANSGGGGGGGGSMNISTLVLLALFAAGLRIYRLYTKLKS